MIALRAGQSTACFAHSLNVKFTMSSETPHKFGVASVMMFLFAGLAFGFGVWYKPPLYEELDQLSGTVKDVYLNERNDESDNSVYLELIVGEKIETLCNPSKFLKVMSGIKIGSSIKVRGEVHHSPTQCTFYPWEIRNQNQVYVDYSEHIAHQEEAKEGLAKLVNALLVLGVIFAVVELIKFNKAKQAGPR